MIIIAKAFDKPFVTVVAVAIVGLSALAFQYPFDQRNSKFVTSEILFLVFTFMTVCTGSALSSKILPRLHHLEDHLAVSSATERTRRLPPGIGKKQWLAIGGLGVLVALVALYTHDTVGISLTGVARFVYFVSIFLNFWVVGAVIGLYGLTLIWLLRLSNREVRIKPFAWRSEIATAASEVYLLVTFCGVALYLLGLLALWETPGGLEYLYRNNTVRQLWILPLAIGVAGYFGLTQLLIHRIIHNAKVSRLAYLGARRDEAFSRWEEGHRPEESEVVDILTRTIEEVAKESTWPLNLPKLLTVLVPIFVPASKDIVNLIDIIFGTNSP